MFCFLFCSFLIKCVFLSHNVIWKQFLPTAGFAFTIGKHVKGKAGKMPSVTREPLPHPLGSRSEADLGSLHKPHQNRECLQTSGPHGHPSSRGSACSLGEKFSECFADKIDQMQTRLPAAKLSGPHVEASQRASPLPTARCGPGSCGSPGKPL